MCVRLIADQPAAPRNALYASLMVAPPSQGASRVTTGARGGGYSLLPRRRLSGKACRASEPWPTQGHGGGSRLPDGSASHQRCADYLLARLRCNPDMSNAAARHRHVNWRGGAKSMRRLAVWLCCELCGGDLGITRRVMSVSSTQIHPKFVNLTMPSDFILLAMDQPNAGGGSFL